MLFNPANRVEVFQSTRSERSATSGNKSFRYHILISIHALRAERDEPYLRAITQNGIFQSTRSERSATEATITKP